MFGRAAGKIRTASTDEAGTFRFTLLTPGRYQLQVSKAGFSLETQSQIEISVAETTNLNFQMQIGTVQEKVEVQAQPVMAQTETSALGRVVSETQIQDLPLVSRDYMQVINLSTGVSSEVTDAGEIGHGTASFLYMHVNGGRFYDNNFLMTGVSINDVQGSGNASGGVPVPNPDTIQEFKVQNGPVRRVVWTERGRERRYR